MATTGGNHSSSRNIWLVAIGAVVIALMGWFVLSFDPAQSGSDEDSTQKKGQGVSQARSDRKGGNATVSDGRTTIRKRPRDSSISEEGEDGPQFPHVHEILGDDGISIEATATRLREIVENKSLSVLEREEALAHGLNLDFSQFVGLVADPQLPQPLAQRFFDEMLNYNEHRDLQVRACISLVDHDDAAMREEAASQLAFYIGLEEWADKPEILKQEAYGFLEDLAKRTPPEPEPANPDADIPETAPINPLESDEDEEAQAKDE